MRLLHVFSLPLTALALFAQTPTQPAPSSASSQQSSSPGYAAPLFNATTRNVILDAVVTDKKGNVVTGLTRNDFVIREDNTPQAIQSFDAVTAGTSAEDATPHTILLIDELNTHFQDMVYARYSVNRLFSTTAPNCSSPPPSTCSPTMACMCSSHTHAIPPPLTRHSAPTRPILSWRLRQNFYLALDRINISMTALQQIAIAATGTPGHKNIVWISPGLPIFWRVAVGRGWPEAVVRFHPPPLRSALEGTHQHLQRRSSRRSGQSPPPPSLATTSAYAAYLNGLSQANDAAFGNWPSRPWPRKPAAMYFTGGTMSIARSPPASPMAIPTTHSRIHPPTRTSTANSARSGSASSAGRI